MSLQFIIGGSGSGKTHRLYEELIRSSIERPEERFFAIVPEQFTMQTQKDIVTLHPRHGVMNIDIVSFERLAYRIFEELSVQSLSILDDMGKSMVLRKVAGWKKKELKLFGSHLEKIGFVGELKSMLSEFFQYGITEEQLEEMVKEADSAMLRQKLQDMLVLYRAFKEYSDGKFMAKEELLELLCRVLPESKLIKGSVVTLDGYTGFTPVQCRLLELLFAYCKKVTVTVTMDPGEHPYEESGPQNLFHLSKRTISRLAELAKNAGAAREPDILLRERPAYRFRNAPELSFIEQELFRYHGRTYAETIRVGEKRRQPSPAGSQQPSPDESRQPSPAESQQPSPAGSQQPSPARGQQPSPAVHQLALYQASNPLDEVEFLACEIERLVKTEGYRYRDIAVVTGALEDYSKEIVRRFDENRIPCFIDYKKNIVGNPLVELIRAALEMLQRDFTYESMFRYLKTGLAVGNREGLNRLENYALAMGIRGFKRWEEPWERTYRGAELMDLEELNLLREEILAPIRPLREVMRDRKSTVRDRTEALVHFLTAIRAEERLAEYERYFASAGQVSLQKEYGQVYGLVMDLFDRLTALLGEEKVSRKEFADILDAGFAEIKVGLIPAVVDRVVVGDITRTRLAHIKTLFFIGVNDGIVPAVSGRGGILTESERRRLKEQKVELAPTAREEGFLQRLYLYLVMTKPSDKLYLSFAEVSSEGKSLRPSSLIAQVRKLFPDLPVRETKDAEGYVWSLSAGKRRLLRGFEDYKRMAADRSFLELYRFFYRSPEFREEMRRLVEAAFYTYEERGIGRTAAKEIYSSILRGSVTRMEQYASCAYAHFLAYGLELRERPVYELEAADIGNLFHSSIDLFFKRMKEEQRSFRDISEEDRERLVDACVSQVTEDYGNTILKSSARNAYLERKVKRITGRTVWALTEQLKKGDFEPEGFEVSFTPADNLRAMRIPLSEEEEIHLKGRIDRIDLCEDGDLLYLKIIDYKSGKTQFDLTELYYGLQLQLVVYMDAAMEKEQRQFPDKKIVPAGIFYYNIADPMVEKREDMDEEETEQAILKQLRMNGLVNGRMDVIEHLDNRIETESDVIPVALKAGLIQEAKSSVAGEKRFEAIREYVHGKLKSMGREILDGRIATAPYKKGDRTSCDFCPYHGVCGFDLKTEGYGYRRFKKMKPEEVWEKIEGPEEQPDEQTERKEEDGHGSKLDERTETGY